MSKVYKIFISSCYNGLEAARKEVFNIVINSNCLPVCMELFPSTYQHKWKYIAPRIDESDYVILLIGGLYGSIDSNGLSYTENEYDYAVSKGKNILVFIQQNPRQQEPEGPSKAKLLLFKEKVCDRQIINYWTDEKDLITKVNVSLKQTFEDFPLPGLVKCPNPDCISGFKVLSVDEAIQQYKNKLVKSVYCICSSGISTSYLIEPLLKRNQPHDNPIDIFIIIRKGDDEKRIQLIKNHSYRWMSLANRQSVKLHIHCVRDFSLSFRGLMINKGEFGYIGFNNNTDTSKHDSVLMVDQTSEAGKYLIKYFMYAFECKTSYGTFTDAIDNAD